MELNNSSSSISTFAPVTPEVSLVVPAYNEANTPVRADAFRRMLEASLSMLGREFPSRHELLVVDDGSSDATPTIAAEFGLTAIAHIDGQNHGKGAAVRVGLLRAQGDYRAFADADGAYSSDTILELLSTISNGEADIAVASRSATGHESLLRRAGHTVLEKICQHYAPTDSLDTQAGAKAFTAGAAENIWPLVRAERYAADREAMYLANQLGYRVVDVTAEVTVVPGSHVRVVRDTIQIIKDTRAIRRQHQKSDHIEQLTVLDRHAIM